MIFRQNGRLPPTARHTYLESYDTQLSFGLSGNCFSASYEASGFCWQIGLNFLKHLRPCHILSPWIPGPRLLLRYHFNSSGWFVGIRFRWIFLSKSSATHFFCFTIPICPESIFCPVPLKISHIKHRTNVQFQLETFKWVADQLITREQKYHLRCQPDSGKGSHGLITYASTSCAGGNDTLTKPCPKVCKDTTFKNIKI